MVSSRYISHTGMNSLYVLKIGPIIRVYFGVQPWIMISDPNIAHELFSTKGSVTSGRPWQLYSHQYYAPGQR